MKNTENINRYDDACDEAYQLFVTGQFEHAYEMYKKILGECPEQLRALHGIGVVLHKLGRSEEGIASVRKALELKPDFADAIINLGNILVDIRRYEEAIGYFSQLIKIKPDNDVAYKNLALVFILTERLDEALEACQMALTIDPHQPENFMAMGNVYSARGDAAQALKMYSKVCALAPASSNAHTNVLFNMNFLSKFSQKDIYLESKKWEKCHARPRDIRRPHLNYPLPGRRLRIGYVSGDFKLHPVSYHLKPVVGHHNHESFEIFLYSNSNKIDEMTEKLIGFADQWRNIYSLSDERVDKMIRMDEIDILVDLSGHTSLHKLLLFARKPAPIQVSWIGYFNTTGMTAMDYCISDEVTVPLGEERWFSEHIVRVPNGRFCYEPPDYAPAVAKLPALKNGYITFGSFNKLAKISPETVVLWSAVLKSVPLSRIVIKTSAIGADSIKKHLLDQFDEYGVGSDRIELRTDSPHPLMLEQYGDIDIALDTFPFNGGATTCEALWMGVPVVTMTGATPISRQSASLLASCGLSRFVADSPARFVTIVQELLAVPECLSALRSSLRAQLSNSPLCDGGLFTGNLERAYRDMWKEWCQSQKNIPLKHLHSSISADEYYNAGINRMNEKDYSSAVAFFRRAVRKQPNFADALNNRGICLFSQGNKYYKQAAKDLRHAIRLKPSFGEAYNNLGRILTEIGRYSQAVRICRAAVELMPENPDAYINLGNACREKGLLMESLVSYEMAAQLKPTDSEPLCMAAGVKMTCGDPVGAIEYLKSAMKLAPQNPFIHSNILFAMNYVQDYSQEDMLDEACMWDLKHGTGITLNEFRIKQKTDEKIRVGYVSADFHRHPGGIFFQAVARHHDSSSFEMFCYYNSKQDPDEINIEIRKFTEQWRNIANLTDDELHSLIVRDQIDILVDLSGHTSGHRLQVFSRRAAPIQISWLGYFNTTGVENMDYVISDSVTVPPSYERWYREKVLRMPYNRFCYTPPVICPDVDALPASKYNRITFGCFNNIAKLTSDVIETWAEILLNIPESRLVLKWKSLSEKNVRDHYRTIFSLYGIPRSRLEFRGESPPFIMRDEYNDIDIALDPFPFTGGITSCEALWMGVPVITLAGNRPVSRQTAGFLQVIGLTELAAETVSGYVDCAIRLATDYERLASLRHGLRRRFTESPLCDGPGFTGSLEDIYRKIWQAKVDSYKSKGNAVKCLQGSWS